MVWTSFRGINESGIYTIIGPIKKSLEYYGGVKKIYPEVSYFYHLWGGGMRYLLQYMGSKFNRMSNVA